MSSSAHHRVRFVVHVSPSDDTLTVELVETDEHGNQVGSPDQVTVPAGTLVEGLLDQMGGAGYLRLFDPEAVGSRALLASLHGLFARERGEGRSTASGEGRFRSPHRDPRALMGLGPARRQ